MKNAIIIHGLAGYPEENWFPWLRVELEKIGYTVFVPKFPTLENQSLTSWLLEFKDYKKYLGKDTILIGHSLGVPFILNILEKHNFNIKASFLVAGYIGRLDIPEVDRLNKTFTEKKFDWKKIRKNCKEFILFNSDNDPYVKLEKAIELKENLSGSLRLIKNAGHFNKKSGYLKFDELLKEIKKIK